MLTNSQINQIINITELAGSEILKIYQSSFEVNYKSDNSPVTEADKVSSNLILKYLKELAPEIPAISEEENIPDYQIRKNWNSLWLIDPLDGTKEFINKRDEFTVNIALITNGIPIFGIIHHPVRQQTYYAQLGEGAFKISGQKVKLPIIQNNLQSKETLVVAGSRSHSSDNFMKYIEILKPDYKDIEIKRLGSSYKFCLTADGSIDIYPRFGRTMEWDTAAGQIICNEVGLKIKERNQNTELIYNKEDLRNPWFLAASETSFEKLRWL